ncbi:MAG: DEAD/DEAH box helicase [Acidobacteria bacterium]|nr:MAG: DEAD/DEAH box helicase [Acidobacteriota bacterium]MCE7957059.1 ATP-dependent helicase [Acidobacteria bacterium ACB2]
MPPSGFDRLHPAVQHHVVNSLGWRSLRPLQESAIDPLLDGDHALLIAPTAGGKTEAAVLPLLSRMCTEEWRGLSVLYVCPLRALLNNLLPRLERMAGFAGRRAAMWHGDVGEGDRRRIKAEPPDFLLTTPESLEVMLTSRRVDRAFLLGSVRAVVIDELHAFAGDDRGWHLVSVLERVSRIAGRDVQRVGLSATVGNPEDLLGWLAGGSAGRRRVVSQEPSGGAEPEVRLDWVATQANAAQVIARLHRDEKRLVFCDSRARVEELTFALREAGVPAFAAHGSLAAEERRRAEEAFGGAEPAVIVATSALELGIDIGDLDRLLQVDAPATVSSFLQRLGRTGRRPGTRRNCLFLATDDEAFLRAAALLRLWRGGWVEPVAPPASPFHILAQQLLALALQTSGLPRHGWTEWIGGMPGFAAMDGADAARIEEYLLEKGFLFDDGGVVSFGPEGEASFGGRRFLELLSVFSSDPLFSVRFGAKEIGKVDPATFQLSREGDPVLLLAGQAWHVTRIEWQDRIAYVDRITGRGKSVWLGEGPPLSFEVCRAVRDVLTEGIEESALTARGRTKLEELRQQFGWVPAEGTALVEESPGRVRWWTFAGLKANAALADALASGGATIASRDNLSIAVLAPALPDVSARVGRLREAGAALEPTSLVADAVDGLKFSDCVPRDLALAILRRRLSDSDAVARVLGEPVLAVGGPKTAG